MSRIGRKPIIVPTGVQLTVADRSVSVKGPKGQLSFTLNPAVTVTQTTEEGQNVVNITVAMPDNKKQRAQWGTTRALIQNMIVGVTDGFTRSLEVVGVGYRANVQGTKVVFDVGYSHPVDFQLPEGVTAKVEKSIVTVSGADRQAVGETAARMRRIRKPEPYKGTGIKFTDEVIRRKAGKTGKAAA